LLEFSDIQIRGGNGIHISDHQGGFQFQLVDMLQPTVGSDDEITRFQLG
jgi:hypothetical protein